MKRLLFISIFFQYDNRCYETLAHPSNLTIDDQLLTWGDASELYIYKQRQMSPNQYRNPWELEFAFRR